MICEPCCRGANAFSNGFRDTANDFHKQCKGDCCCQHKTTKGYVANDGKVHLNQTQSP